ncbi:hypothetical protein NQ911_17530 [Acinetobacter baumannii]|nr:hypothetical protein [Acinetobacter baumannii]
MKNSEPQYKENLQMGASISPLVVPLVIGIAYGTVILFQGDISGAFAIFLMYLMFGLPFTYIITFALVLPMAIFLRKLNALTAAGLYLWCTLLGPVTFYAYLYLLNGGPEPTPNLSGIILSLLSGFISGVAFCLFARI